ncbi:MAG: sulfite exporter TauE/SafE family protein [Actinomycetota bacterium]|nr:sulfite exporter TauE/SafE family protein [Actinomycetota bacterium]
MTVLVVAAGVAVGAFAALFGVGGSIVMVPLMTLALEVGQKEAEGTSLLVVIPTALVAAIAHSRRGFVDLGDAAFLGAGGIVGAFAGAQVALGTSGRTLRLVFGVFLIVVGLRMAYEGLKRESGAGGTA